jgi:SAM-dependent MidA family methyltransferase
VQTSVPWMAWRSAWQQALLGTDGFYRHGPGSLCGAGPSGHFRTSASVGQGRVLAQAILGVLKQVDIRLGGCDRLDVLEVGAGDGALANALMAAIAVDSSGMPLRDRVQVTCIDVHERPGGLMPNISWITGTAQDVLAEAKPITGLVLAHEWLDTIACEVVEVDASADLRVVLVNKEGAERLGPRLSDTHGCAKLGVDSLAVNDWIARWWPGRRTPGERIEVGIERDNAMQSLTTILHAGTVLAIDYSHDLHSRRSTLAGYRNGRLVPPIPDGSCDITAHVALDSCANAAHEAARSRGLASRSTMRHQREVLGPVTTDMRWPDPPSARTNPWDYAAALEEMSNSLELVGRDLGSFAWLQIDID